MEGSAYNSRPFFCKETVSLYDGEIMKEMVIKRHIK